MDLSYGSYYLVPYLLAGAVASWSRDVPAAPHARASGRARRDRVRVGRIHIVVNVLDWLKMLVYVICIQAGDR
jgi:hypothetical protein